MTLTVERSIAQTRINNCGYVEVRLSKDGKSETAIVHRLVAQAFVQNPLYKPQVNYINGIKTNNRPANLDWVTHAENMKHAYDTGLFKIPYSKCKSMVDICTGERFQSIKQAAQERHPDYPTCKNYLKRHRRNPTCLRYGEEEV